MNNGEIDAKESPMSCLCKQKGGTMQVLWIPGLFTTLHCWLDKCNSRVDYCFQGSLLTVSFKKVSELCSLKKDYVFLSNCHMWLHKMIKYSDNLKYQCCVLYLLISPIRTSSASYSYIRHKVHNKDLKIFYPLCFIWPIKILPVVIYFCITLKFKKFNRQIFIS